MVFPDDYKRRRHYDMNVGLMQAGLLAAPEPVIPPSGAKK